MKGESVDKQKEFIVKKMQQKKRFDTEECKYWRKRESIMRRERIDSEERKRRCRRKGDVLLNANLILKRENLILKREKKK